VTTIVLGKMTKAKKYELRKKFYINQKDPDGDPGALTLLGVPRKIKHPNYYVLYLGLNGKTNEYEHVLLGGIDRWKGFIWLLSRNRTISKEEFAKTELLASLHGSHHHYNDSQHHYNDSQHHYNDFISISQNDCPNVMGHNRTSSQ